MIVEVQSDRVHSKAMPDLISKIVVERQEVLVLFNRLAELKPYTDATQVQPCLQRFCEVLMDYMALGHFEVYQCIEENADSDEHCRQIKQLAQELYPFIAQSTRAAVDFNDRYDCQDHCQVLNDLGEDLSLLGERLADRVELEDKLITAINRVMNTH